MQARDVKPCGTAVDIGPIAKEKGRNDTREKAGGSEGVKPSVRKTAHRPGGSAASSREQSLGGMIRLP